MELDKQGRVTSALLVELIENQARRCVVDHLERFHCARLGGPAGGHRPQSVLVDYRPLQTQQ